MRQKAALAMFGNQAHGLDGLLLKPLVLSRLVEVSARTPAQGRRATTNLNGKQRLNVFVCDRGVGVQEGKRRLVAVDNCIKNVN